MATLKVFNNYDLLNLILSFNKCTRCESVFCKENKKINIHFYYAYSFVSYKWLKRICYDCLKLQICRKI